MFQTTNQIINNKHNNKQSWIPASSAKLSRSKYVNGKLRFSFVAQQADDSDRRPQPPSHFSP